MQPKYRNSSDEFRSFGRYRSRNNDGGGFSRNYSKSSYKNPPPVSSRKIDIMMEAGRLAAEYLVAKGMLLPNALPANSSNSGGNVRKFRGHGRENEGRTSAVARLGDAGLEAGYRKRRFDDDYDRPESQMNSRDRKRMGYYDRERGRNGSWNERNRGYSDSMEGEDDIAPGYCRERRGGFDDVGSRTSRVAGDEQHSKIEAIADSGSELDDSGSKACSNSTKKDTAPDGDADLSKEMDATEVMNVEAGEIKGDESSGFEKKMMTLADDGFNDASVGNGNESADDNQSDPVKLCGFTKVPRLRPSSLAHKCLPVDKTSGAEESNKVEGALGGAAEMAADTAPAEGSPTVHGGSAISQVPVNSGSAVDNSNNETPAQQSELDLDVQNSERSMMTIDDKNRAPYKEEPEKDAKSSPAGTPQENELSPLGSAIPAETSMVGEMPSQDARIAETGMVKDVPPLDVGMAKTNMVKEVPSQDVEMMEPVDRLKPDLATKDEIDTYARAQQEKHNLSASFKIFDLNLMEAPEITEIPDDTDTSHISAPPLEAGNELPVDFGPPAGSKAKNTCEYNCRPSDEKVIPVIDLEDDSPREVNAACETSKPKNEMLYPSVENILNQATNVDDLQVMQNNYSLAVSDYLGGDISCSPSVQADLTNLQGGMGLPGPEGYPGVEDAIYGSLGDIGFMEAWDQPTHEYEKFF